MSAETTIDVEKLLPWSEGKSVNTKNGPRNLRTAAPTDAFWSAWRSAKDQLRAAGVSCGRDNKTGEWQVCWWQVTEAGAKEIARRQESMAASSATDADIEIPVPDGLAYLPYQKAGVKFALDGFARGESGILIGDEMGLGKTIQAIGAINADRSLGRVLIVCPCNLRVNWKRELSKWIARDLSVAVVSSKLPFPRIADVVVVNYDILHNFERELRAEEWDLVVCDECFPAGTLVRTPNGYIPIESIVVGQLVCNAIGVGRVVATSRKTARRLVRVRLVDGVSFDCTPEHPILTQSGFIQACNLNATHYIKTHDQTLRILRRGVSENQDETFLRDILLSEMENVSARFQAEDLLAVSGVEDIRVSKEELLSQPTSRKVGQRSDEAGEPNEVGVHSEKGFRNTKTNWSRPADPRRKRNGSNSARGEVVVGIQESCLESSNPDQLQIGTWLSDLLQSGSSVQESEISRRDRRWIPRRDCAEGDGQKERREAYSTRVACVEVLESAGNGGDRVCEVYNLQVSGHPSYVVTTSDLVVHNCHYIKTPTARRTRQIKGYVPKNSKDPKKAKKEAEMAMSPIPCKRRIALTGTPIVNTPVELWTILNWLNPQRYGNFFKYSLRYCDAKRIDIGRGRTAWDFSGASNLDELRMNLRATLMVRRLKKDVLLELPPKRRQVIEIPNDLAADEGDWDEQEREVEELGALVQLAAVSDDPEAYKAAVERLKKAQSVLFESMSSVRLDLGMAKLPFVIEHLQNALEESDKIVVFGHHRQVLESLKSEFGEMAVLLYGGMSAAEKQDAVDRFQNDPKVRLFFGQDDASGVGITLVASSHVVFAEGNWVPGNLSQCEDRTHRIGQRKSVLVQHLVFEKTLDARMIKRCIEKQEVIEQALDTALPPEAFEPVSPSEHVTITVRELDQSKQLPDDQVQAIHLGLRMLSAVCNGARSWDGAGFNKMDTRIGKDLASRPGLSLKQAILGLKLVTRYRGQLPEEVVARAGAQKKEKKK